MLPREGDARFNYILGVLNGAMFQFGTAFLDPTTVVPVFIKNFTGSDFVVGLASAVRRGGWYLPQLPMAGYLEQRPYKRGIYLGANAVRMGLVWLFIPLLMTYGADHPSRMLAAFLVIFSISSLSGGLAGSPFIDIVGKTIPPQFRGQFYAIRTFFGAGVLSVLAGFVVQYILGREERFPFPQNYTLLFGLSAGFMSLGIICFGFVREPPGKLSSTRRTALGVIREIPDILRRDINFRRLFFTQVLSAGVGFSLPFYVVLAREVFGTSESTTGIFLIMQTLGASAATAIWGRVSSRQGNRQIVRLSVMAQAVPFMPWCWAWGSPGRCRGYRRGW